MCALAPSVFLALLALFAPFKADLFVHVRVAENIEPVAFKLHDLHVACMSLISRRGHDIAYVVAPNSIHARYLR